MPLNAVGWSSEEDEKLVELVQPHSYLYNLSDPSRKNILARESTWQEIAQQLFKPVEECKKRWRGLRDSYMRSKRMGTMHKTKATMFEKLQFLDTSLDGAEEVLEDHLVTAKEDPSQLEELVVPEQQEVITDNQEYYEITVLENPQQDPQVTKPYIKIVPKNLKFQSVLPEPPKRAGTGGTRKNAGRKKSLPMPRNNGPPIKILPKPVITMNDPGIVRYIEDSKITPPPEQRSQVIDKLIEKVLKENTNEIDVFFRSMAASVKKLQPILIPKVKMEVCNVIAKYEMLNFDKNM